ncbi:MAG: ImmA/IrrE family metallo-endopeptidase [Candidatus Paceibacterota bacterium]
MADSYQLTKQEIESQVLSDLSKYRRQYTKKYGKATPTPLDVDNYVQELWNFGVVFEKVESDSEEQETLGFLRPEAQQVVVNEDCTNQRRISFTVAHEAGHLSLHGPLFTTKDGVISGWKSIPLHKNTKKSDTSHIRREWQANVYAGALLASHVEIEELLQELGLIKDGILTPFNLEEYFPKFEERFGLSRQALEIRLGHLNIPTRKSNTV